MGLKIYSRPTYFDYKVKHEIVSTSGCPFFFFFCSTKIFCPYCPANAMGLSFLMMWLKNRWGTWDDVALYK